MIKRDESEDRLEPMASQKLRAMVEAYREHMEATLDEVFSASGTYGHTQEEAMLAALKEAGLYDAEQRLQEAERQNRVLREALTELMEAFDARCGDFENPEWAPAYQKADDALSQPRESGDEGRLVPPHRSGGGGPDMATPDEHLTTHAAWPNESDGGEPKVQCVACEGRGFDPNYNRIFEMFDPQKESEPNHGKGFPTVRESEHGGYVWTYCKECGPDVSVDEDGLCIGCGRDAVYFGNHPELSESGEGKREIGVTECSECEECEGNGSIWDYTTGQGIDCPCCSDTDASAQDSGDASEALEAWNYALMHLTLTKDTRERIDSKIRHHLSRSEGVPEAVRRLPDNWRSHADTLYGDDEGAACAHTMKACAEELADALAAHDSGQASVPIDRVQALADELDPDEILTDEDELHQRVANRLRSIIAAAPTPDDSVEE